MRHIILIAHNLRSCHNVGALLRTADGLGIEAVYLTGYTPYPHTDSDVRIPHLARKINVQIHKTALGAEQTVKWIQQDDVMTVIATLRSQGYTIVALEQTLGSIQLPGFQSHTPIALIVGREVEGIEPDILAASDITLEIPMVGTKESYNVASAAAMALYHLTYVSHVTVKG